MATLIESLSGITIRSPYFSANPTLEFFPHNNRLNRTKRTAVMFGPNGSGKSTIAKGFREYVDTVNPHTVEIELMSGSDILSLSPDARPKKIFIFDETYIDRSVKIQSSGLEAIVLFGEQVQLEQQIQATERTVALSDKLSEGWQTGTLQQPGRAQHKAVCHQSEEFPFCQYAEGGCRQRSHVQPDPDRH